MAGSTSSKNKASKKKTAGKAAPEKKVPAKTGSKAGGPAARMRELEELVRKHQYLYYVKNQPVVTDREFDRLFGELQELEAAHPELAAADSPTRVVGSDLDNEFRKVEHTIPVLSLSNTYSTAEALEWAAKTAAHDKNPDKVKFIVQWKVDGAALVLYYEKGKLARAVTRGTGRVGDDVTSNALTIRNVPHLLNEPVDIAVRGEVFMTFADFEKFNEREGSIYANPRNTASGSMKHKKSREVATRPLRMVAFDGHFAAKQPPTDEKALAMLSKLGLPVSDDNRVTTLAKLESVIAELEKKRESMPMPVDGLVLKIDSHSLRDDLGYTAASPRWAVSLKFEPEIGETEVKEIEVFVGRTGRVTPRARLEPVKLAGTTVTYATLHNADFVKNLGVRVGSRVKVSKRGEIIPAVEEVVDPGKGPVFKFPVKCPVCSSKLVREENAVDWLCPNPDCDEKLKNALIFFCQRKQMDIVGMGEKIVRLLFDKGFIKHIEDIYNLPARRDEIQELEGFGEKSVNLLLLGIENSKARDFRYVLPSLGLREVGHSVTELLIGEGYDDVDKIIKLANSKDAAETLAEIDGIGPRTADWLIKQFRDKSTRERIKKLKKAGLQFSARAPAAEESDLPQIFAGQTWCVTGSFERFKPRDLAMAEVKKRGGKATGSVTSRTTHLLAGEKAGSKLEKAEKLGVEVVDEAAFLAMIRG